jgi:hypothetical protein
MFNVSRVFHVLAENGVDPLTSREETLSEASSSLNERPGGCFPCPVCKTEFRKKVERRRHVLGSHLEVCRCCGDLYQLSEEVQDEGQCPVNTCGRLVSHVNAHIVWEHRANYCKHCPASFASAASLANHVCVDGVQSQLEIDSLPGLEPEPEPEPEWQLSEHVLDDEEEERNGNVKLELMTLDHKCEYCGRAFARASKLQEHVSSSHFGCVICDAVLNDRASFNEHLKTHSSAGALRLVE